MAISLRSKVDFLFKKLGFAVARTDSDSLKGATNESIPSPLIIRGDLTWNKAGSIPAAIPDSDTEFVKVYGSNNLVQTVADGTASTNRTWLTNSTNWITPEFGATYQVKVYVHDTDDSDNAAGISNQVFASGSGNDDEWFFDYSAGVLHFMGENLPNGVSFTGKSVYISGARYVGPLGLNEFVPNAMNESDQAVVSRHTSEIDNLRLDVDSDHAAFQAKINAIEGIGDSDLTVVADLRNEVDQLRLDLDSDFASFNSRISGIAGIGDSDLKVVADLRNEVDQLRLDLDSDSFHIQSFDSEIKSLNLKIVSLMADRDSDTAALQDLGRRLSILEAAVGVTPSQPDATPVPTDSETLGLLQFSTDSDNVLQDNITVTWRVIAGDGATVTINTVLFAKGMTDANVLQILYINIIDHPVANRYWEVFALREGNSIEYAFKEKYSELGYTLTVTVVERGEDNAVFTNTVPTG